LSYREQQVLVAGVADAPAAAIGTSAPTAHSSAVVRGLEGYIDLFVTQIHDANK